MPDEITTTQDVPIWFPDPKKKKKVPYRECMVAVDLIEHFKLDYEAALNFVIESEVDSQRLIALAKKHKKKKVKVTKSSLKAQLLSAMDAILSKEKDPSKRKQKQANMNKSMNLILGWVPA